MGDGAVVCMPSQQQRLADRFPICDASWSGNAFVCAAGKKMNAAEEEEQVKEPEKASVELETGEFAPEINGELENGEIVPEKGVLEELEMGEFVPDEWDRLEEIEEIGGKNSQEDQRRKGRDRSNEKKVEFSGFDDRSWRREDRNRIDRDHSKRSSRNDSKSESTSRRHERSSDRRHGRDNSTSRERNQSRESERKHHVEFEGSSASKFRRISGDNGSRSDHQEKLRSSSPRGSSSKRYLSSRRHAEKSGSSTKSRHDRDRHHSQRNRSRSPRDRARRSDRHDRAPSCLENSPQDGRRKNDHRSCTPSRRDRSPRDRARHYDHREKLTPSKLDRSPQTNGKEGSHKRGSREEKPRRREIEARESTRHTSSRQSDRHSRSDKVSEGSMEKESMMKRSVADTRELPPPPPLSPPPLQPPLTSGFFEDHQHSMEEDMDICDTPPHIANPVEQNFGRWYYLDDFGLERGPSRLAELKRLVEEGVLPSDHLIKHVDSNRWETVENAVSPLIMANSASIVSDAVTQMVKSPEASGNLSIDAADLVQDQSRLTLLPDMCLMHDPNHFEPEDDFHIDERVESLLQGHEIIPGREIEIIEEALKATFERVEWEKWGQYEGFTRCRAYAFEIHRHSSKDDGTSKSCEGLAREGFDARSATTLDKDSAFPTVDSTELLAGRWSCKGGDWRRNDENANDRFQKRKLVLNEGFPLCQMPKKGDDPRPHGKDESSHSSSNGKLDLPTWAFSWTDDRNENSGDSARGTISGRQNPLKNLASRGVKGNPHPVVRVNACAFRDGLFSSEPCPKINKAAECLPPRSSRSHSVGSEKSSTNDVSTQSKKVALPDNRSSLQKDGNAGSRKDRICSIGELSVNIGSWYYLDGTGREHGPFSSTELQDLVADGIILQNSSVFRKADNIWIPVTAGEKATKMNCSQDEKGSKSNHLTSESVPPISVGGSLFNDSYPHYIGYTRGKLHELVMKSFRSREFAAAIHEVLDPWIIAKQPKKEMERHFAFNSSITKSSAAISHDASDEGFWNTDTEGSGSFAHAGKRARLLLDETDEDYRPENHSFEELWIGREADEDVDSGKQPGEGWGMLGSYILARIFHFLRGDIISLHLSGATCKHWKAAAQTYKNISRQVDLSVLGSSCTDSMLRSIMYNYDKSSISSLTLSNCANISAAALEEILQSFTGIATVDIRGCTQFKELVCSFQNIKWIRSRSSQIVKNLDGSFSKTRCLKWVADKNLSSSRSSNIIRGELANPKDTIFPTFRQGCYERRRLPETRKSSSAFTRHAQLRQLQRKKSLTAYRKMEEFIRTKLKEIMKENTFDFFVLRVAYIEDNIKNGYYERRGLSSIKEDIRRMCRDALKVKKKGDSGDMKQVLSSFLHLAKHLEDSKSSRENDGQSWSLRERLDAGLSEGSKHRKKSTKNVTDKRGTNKNNRFSNGGPNHESTLIDPDVRKNVKLNRRHLSSESETSEDENELTEYDTVSDSDGKTSDTGSELDIQLESSRNDDGKESTLTWDDSLDSMADDREWGARMTKASLVPPVTRKYEVIDQYVVVADEEEVKRKMAVALPEDYEEKLRAQKSGLDETDMQIPEVKDYKPRKTLGVEVIEQEVYGIDPYTHNLLLDSMPDDADWPLVEKHNFIEEILLRELNKQARRLTGSGNTPMVYHLKSVIEEINKTADEGGDSRLIKLSNTILKAMHSRPDDNYVAYRKGLGVVCNKDGGFGEDDFVVEFLGEVYPAWKWFEKQDGIRSMQKNNKDPAPEFYNIYLERPKGDRDGYDLVVVDAMHKANYASRICHSCRPNCEAKVTAVDGQYQIGIYAVRPIAYGEEITFDYNSVTESKEEYEASVCLCGTQVCRGSYLNLTGEDAFQNVLKECHGLLDRHKLMLESCEANFISQEDYMDLGRAGLGRCLLDGLPKWLIAYSARLVRFMNFERTKLPEEILKHNIEEKKKFFVDICIETEKIEAENQAEGVYNQRLQNLALTLDKVRYVMRCAFGDPKKAPPPLERLTPEELVTAIWTGKDSLVEELLGTLASHLQSLVVDDLRSKVAAHTPSGPDLHSNLKKSLLWLRDELRAIPCSQRCHNDGAADLVHLYAHTKCFFRIRGYKTVKSPPVYISPLDLGPKYVEKMGAGFNEYCKTYGENYCLGQLIFWHNQTSADPDSTLVRARRGCLVLPDMSSFFPADPSSSLYGPRTVRFMLSRMEKQPQRPWPKDQIWHFRSLPKLLGSPMLDAILAGGHALDRDMIHWLKTRPSLPDHA
ncbi:SET domain protein 2 [Wolffia australiana]